MYIPARATPGFGDILSAEWFHSAFIRKDARPLAPGPQAAGGAPTWRAAEPAPNRDLLLAHGRGCPVILIGDPCEIESVLMNRGGNRLLVAGITPWNEQAQQWLAEGRQRDFRRHLLPPEDGYAGGVVQFGMIFDVARESVADAQRDWSLESGAQVNLEVAWEAYAVRRGPRAVADSARKLAALLTADGDEVIAEDVLAGTVPTTTEADEARALVEEALGVAWDIEGALLNDVSDALERGVRRAITADELRTETSERREALGQAFAKLAELATTAAAKLHGEGEEPAAAPATA